MAEFLKKVVAPSGGDYTSLEACMNANEQDLTGDGWFTVEISGDWTGAPDTTAVTVDGYTTTASDYINIYTTGTARHDGTAGKATAYKLRCTNATAVTIQDDYVTINGLVVEMVGNATASDNKYGIYVNSVTGCPIKNNVVLSSGSISASDDNWNGIRFNHGSTGTRSYYCYNNIVYNFVGGGGTSWDGIAFSMATNYTAKTVYCYNNTVYNCTTTGIYFTMRSTNALYVSNNICIGNGTDFSFTGYGGESYSVNDYNASSDATATGANSLNSGTAKVPSTADFVSITGGSENLHLASTAVEIDEGTDLGSPYNVDIDGTTRTGTWDIGADEYVSTGSPSASPSASPSSSISASPSASISSSPSQSPSSSPSSSESQSPSSSISSSPSESPSSSVSSSPSNSESQSPSSSISSSPSSSISASPSPSSSESSSPSSSISSSPSESISASPSSSVSASPSISISASPSSSISASPSSSPSSSISGSPSESISASPSASPSGAPGDENTYIQCVTDGSGNDVVHFWVDGVEVARLKPNGDLDLHGNINESAF